VDGHALDEADDAGLGRGVGCPTVAAQAGDRGDADDRSAAPLDQPGDGAPGGQEHRLQVDREDLVPLRLGGLEEILPRLDPDVVVQDVEAAEPCHRRRHHPTAPRSAPPVPWAVWAPASPPSARISRTVSSARLSSWSTQRTRAPSRAKRMAVALPFPIPGPREPAPVTMATLPARRPVIRDLP